MKSQNVGRVRWIITAFLFIETVLSFLDLETLSVVAPILTKQLHVTNIEYARITQVFEVAYLIGFVLGGWVIDKLGVRWGLAVAIAWWSLAELGHGFAHTAGGLMACRFLLGLAYPGASLAAAKAASKWYPPEERALVMGLYTSGATIGATIAPPLVAWLALSWGWQYAFVIPGVAGLIYVVFWLLFYNDPSHHRFLSEPERHFILSGQPELPERTHLLRKTLPFLFGSKLFWAIFLGKMIGDTPLIFYVYWTPKFLNEAQGLDLRTIGMVAWVPFLFADLGSVGGGWLSSRFVRLGVDPVKARLRVMTICAAMSAFACTIHFVHSTAVVLGLMSFMTLVTMGWVVSVGTLPVDVFPTEIVSTVVGLTTAGTVLGQIMFTYVVGRTVQAYSYGPLFYLMSLMAPVAYILVRLILTNAQQAELKPTFR